MIKPDYDPITESIVRSCISRKAQRPPATTLDNKHYTAIKRAINHFGKQLAATESATN